MQLNAGGIYLSQTIYCNAQRAHKGTHVKTHLDLVRLSGDVVINAEMLKADLSGDF